MNRWLFGDGEALRADINAELDAIQREFAAADDTSVVAQIETAVLAVEANIELSFLHASRRLKALHDEIDAKLTRLEKTVEAITSLGRRDVH